MKVRTVPPKHPSVIVQERLANKDGKLPWGFWKHPQNRRIFFDYIGNQLGVKRLDDWYKIKSKDFKRLGIFSLLKKNYKGSVYSALSSVYPEHSWSGWKFAENSRIPRHCLSDKSQLHKFMHELSDKLFIKHLDDWYRVSNTQLLDSGAFILIKKFKTLSNVLQTVYPHFSWDKKLFANTSKKSSQRWLKIVLTNLFKPGTEILENYQHPGLKWEGTRRKLELDIFLPSLNLAFEYNGIQHYKNIGYFAPSVQYQQRDSIKEQACKKAGITLISIPYWWDKKKESLLAAILLQQPHLSEHFTQESNNNILNVVSNWIPIPSIPPLVETSSDPLLKKFQRNSQHHHPRKKEEHSFLNSTNGTPKDPQRDISFIPTMATLSLHSLFEANTIHLMANPHFYDYIHCISLNQATNGFHIGDGGGQVINAEYEGSFELIGKDTLLLKFQVRCHPYSRDASLISPFNGNHIAGEPIEAHLEIHYKIVEEKVKHRGPYSTCMSSKTIHLDKNPFLFNKKMPEGSDYQGIAERRFNLFNVVDDDSYPTVFYQGFENTEHEDSDEDCKNST